MKSCLLSVFLLLSVVAFAASPVHEWDFARASGQTVPDKGTAKPPLNYKNKAKEQGAIHCPEGSYRCIVCPKKKWDMKEMTLDVRFRLDSIPDGKARALFSYENKAWRQCYFLLQLNAKNQLELKIAQRDKDVVLKSFSLASEKLELVPGAWHNARVTLTSGGEGRLWLDARLVAAQKGALSLSDLDYQPAEWYPLVCFGVDPANPQQKSSFLRGSIASVRVWDCVMEPDPLFDAPLPEMPTRDFSHILVTDAGTDEEWTCPFQVLDSEGALAGSTVTADERYVRTAGKASAHLDGDTLVVTFRCGIPPGTDPKKVPGGSVWAGDAVEFFFRPDLKKSAYFHYCAGINGALYTAHDTSPRMEEPGFTSKATVTVTDTPREWQAVFRIPIAEIGLDKTPGSIYACNFTRSGPASGGLQTWGPLATDFHQPESFPLMIVGNRKDYFTSRLEQAHTDLKNLNHNAAALVKKAEGILAELEKVIVSHGADRDWFTRIDSSFSNLKNLYTSIALEGRAFLLWEPEDAYGNKLEISMFARPVEKISITMPRNSEARRGLVFTNMTDAPFLGQIKCFEQWPLRGGAKAYNSEPYWNNFLGGLRFAEGLPIMDSARNIIYDPLSPLPMNTVIRTAANGTVPIWLTVSSQGLEAGTYSGQIVVKGDYPGFGTQVIALEVKVLSADPQSYQCINMNFTYMQRHDAQAAHTRFLADHGLNTIFASMPGYPEMNEDGTIGQTDYEKFDKGLAVSFANGFDVRSCHLIFYMAMEKKWAMLHEGKARFPYGTPKFEKAFKLFLQDLAGHLKDRFGIRPEQIIFYPCDEPGGSWDDPKSTMNIAWNTGNWIREAVPQAHRFIDPHPFGAKRKKLDFETMEHIFSLYDIVMLYRPANTLPDVIAAAKKHNCTIWTYGILDKAVHAATYRRFFWQNLHEGLGSTAAFWHVDSHAGGDGFDSFDCSGYNARNRSDYGTVYPDWNYGTVLSGRRFEAWRDGFDDYRLGQLCLNAVSQRPDKEACLNQIHDIFASGAQGAIPAMENARSQLLELYEKIKP